ncbi:cell division protein SepF [uncultured Collinsella sp.]|uniref:cell division protein SepF n=1 Tax=uncultured Collinsella sp. TaxID=165190 RepID=UPI002673A1DD|nr:cell division protein SepF [uncultured Collinsella sp.]
MSFLDDIKSRFGAGRGSASEPYGDDQYDDYYGEDGDAGYEDYPAGYGQPAQDTYRGYEPSDSGNGMLGQTRRGEAESVAVYTRSGQLVGEADRHASSYGAPTATGRDGAYRPGAYDTPSSYAQAQSQRAAMSSVPTPAAPTSTEARVSAVLEGTPQLPAYVLRPESYDDVETVVRRVRTRQPVALVFAGVRTEVAKRVLDFSYGFACGSGASVREVGDRVFIVLPQGCEVKQTDLANLRKDGYLKQ